MGVIKSRQPKKTPAPPVLPPVFTEALVAPPKTPKRQYIRKEHPVLSKKVAAVKKNQVKK